MSDLAKAILISIFVLLLMGFADWMDRRDMERARLDEKTHIRDAMKNQEAKDRQFIDEMVLRGRGRK